MTHRNDTPGRSATEPTPAVRPPTAGPRRPTRPGWSDWATLPRDTADAARDQEVGECATPGPHAALSSAKGDLPCRRQQQPDRTKRATPLANITQPQRRAKRPRTDRTPMLTTLPPTESALSAALRSHTGAAEAMPSGSSAASSHARTNATTPGQRELLAGRARATPISAPPAHLSRDGNPAAALQQRLERSHAPLHTPAYVARRTQGCEPGPPESTWLQHHQLWPDRPRPVTLTRHAPHLPSELLCVHTMTPATQRPPPKRK